MFIRPQYSNIRAIYLYTFSHAHYSSSHFESNFNCLACYSYCILWKYNKRVRDAEKALQTRSIVEYCGFSRDLHRFIRFIHRLQVLCSLFLCSWSCFWLGTDEMWSLFNRLFNHQNMNNTYFSNQTKIYREKIKYNKWKMEQQNCWLKNSVALDMNRISSHQRAHCTMFVWHASSEIQTRKSGKIWAQFVFLFSALMWCERRE